MKNKIQVLETHHDNRVEWGISFTSHNPEQEDYLECLNKNEAFRLQDRIGGSDGKNQNHISGKQ